MTLDELIRSVAPADHEIHKKPDPRDIKGTGFQLVRAGLLEYREPEYLVDNFLEADNLAMLFGEPAAGKSFVALDLAACIATGRAWKGRETQQGCVIYLAGEGHGGIARRLKAWQQHTGQQLDDAPMFISTIAAQFLDKKHIRDVGEKVRTIALAEMDPVLIIVDTLSRNLGPGDENSDMAEFVTAVDNLRREYAAAALIVHHSGHAAKDRGRGGSQLRAALDAEYRVHKNHGSPIVMIENTKMKDSTEPEPITLRLQEIELGTNKKGEPVTSAVLVKCDHATQADVATKKLSASKLLALNNFKQAAADLGKLNDDGKFAGLHVDDWRKSFYDASTADSEDGKKKAFQRARKDLVESGHMRVEGDIYHLAGQLGQLEESMIADQIKRRGDMAGFIAGETISLISQPLKPKGDKGTTAGQEGTCPVGM